MVNWRDPKVEDICAVVFSRIVCILFGVYLWYFCVTFKHVEGSLVLRKLKFSFAFIPYFLGRYSTGLTLVFMTLVSRGTPLQHCDFGNRAVAILASFIVVASSTTISLRPLVLWKDNWVAFVIFIIFILAHCGFGLGAAIATVRVKWSPYVPQCASTIPVGSHGIPSVIAFYFFTLIWDVVILMFTTTGLHRKHLAKSSTLWRMLYSQGIFYVVIAVAVNIPMLIFSWLNLNGTMDIFFAVPGGVVSVMASSSALISLLKLKREESMTPSRDSASSHLSTQNEGLPSTKTDLEENQLTSHIDLQYMCNQEENSMAL